MDSRGIQPDLQFRHYMLCESSERDRAEGNRLTHRLDPDLNTRPGQILGLRLRAAGHASGEHAWFTLFRRERYAIHRKASPEARIKVDPVGGNDGRIGRQRDERFRPGRVRSDLHNGYEILVLERILPNHWAVTEKGILVITRERSFDAIGRLPFRVAIIGDIGRFTASRDVRLALTHEIDRWDSDILLIDNFR